ncbi:XdhC family protein [Sporosarcina obsidiansis]|uniref:XdhC family protein n=1 Tax=Sporosarcina obsidiansis TaxID=2660748 RepID=UPI001E2AB3AD|nr:XdhC family protein [Sporosarcina obsidiansis]
MAKQSAFEAWLASVEAEKACVLATILQTESPLANQESGRMFISSEGVTIGDLGDKTINAKIIALANQKLSEKKPKSETHTFVLSDQQEISIFIDVYIPPVDLIIFGAGHDAIPVANYSVSLGLRTTVVDSRAFYNSEERFPGAKIIVTNEDGYHEKVKIGNRTYIIVMNHHLEKDQKTLEFVLNSQAPYVGLLGPRSRRDRMLDALKEDGIVFSDNQLSRLFSPIGLDIGASSPEEIAISILAEIIAIKNGHTGGFLQGAEYIHNK